MNANTTDAPGYIAQDELYTIQEIDRRLGLGVAALRAARRKGLVIHKIGRRSYVFGQDLINYVQEKGR